MAQEVRYDKSHHAGGTPEARIASRLRNSGGEEADHIVQKGSGPRPAFKTGKEMRARLNRETVPPE